MDNLNYIFMYKSIIQLLPEYDGINKLTSVFDASVLLLIMNFVIALSSSCGSTRR